MAYLLDTNILSELRKGGRADSRVRDWIDGISPATLHISVLTLFEIRWGINKLRQRGDSSAALVFEHWLETIVVPVFGKRALPITPEIALQAADMRGKAEANADLLIAATSKHHDLTLVTRNIRDFKAFDIPLLNPFDPL